MIAAGHSWRDIQNDRYTRAQLVLFYRETQHLQSSQRADMIENIKAALSKKGAELIKALRKR